MIVDSSAVVSIFLRRPGYERLLERLAAADKAGIGAPTVTEASLELSATTGRDMHPLLSRFLQEFDLSIVPFSEAHYRAAVDAYRRYGGKRHRPGLGFGDCLAFATAALARQPLLAADDRFRSTDLPLA